MLKCEREKESITFSSTLKSENTGYILYLFWQIKGRSLGGIKVKLIMTEIQDVEHYAYWIKKSSDKNGRFCKTQDCVQ